ncbi:class I SAM-dependent methyltransferase [[Eubacterium] cellulosolvens]
MIVIQSDVMPATEQSTGVTMRSIRKTYNEIAAEFDVTRYKPWPQTVEFIDELPDDGRVLDLGCGNGRNIVYLASINRGFRIIGLDFSERMLRIAKNKINDQGLKEHVEFILGDIVTLPFSSSTFDGVLFVAALHHLPTAAQRLGSLQEVERCLKPGTKAFISVWDFEQERFADELARQLKLKDTPTDRSFGDVFVPWTGKRGRIHQRFYHLFYKDEFEQLLGKTGLNIQKIFRACDNYHAIVEKSRG